MRTKLASLGLLIVFPLLPLLAQVADTAPAPLSGQRIFTTPAAASAQQAYGSALNAARLAYAGELDKAMKVALSAADLDDANAIKEARLKLATAVLPQTGLIFKTALANQAHKRYEAAVAGAQRVYSRDLTTALKGAMSAGNLEEANGINTEIKALASVAVAPPALLALKAPGQPSQTARGVSIVRYPKHPTQFDNYNGYLLYTELGKPKGAARTLKSISPWTKEKEENAVVSGYIRIDQAGTYQFRTNSDFDRNELLINGEIVCKFRDLYTPHSIDLSAGLVPFISVGYALATTFVMVEWMPPGQADWSAIPSNLLSH